MTVEREVGGRLLRLSSLDKVLWPATGFTKGDMIDYYVRVAPVLLPHIAGRPLTLGRFPDGVEGKGFPQNECRGRPEWMATAPLTLLTGETRTYCLVNDLPSLVWVANLGTIELHPYLARADRPDNPLALAFDLDPRPPRGLRDCCEVALRVRDELAKLGLAGRPKTSGGTGLHVFADLDGTPSYDETRALARAVAGRLAAALPELVSDSTVPRERAGKVFVDWLQNSPRRSTVAPYSLRATSLPRVSMPLTWEEVERADEAALRFSPADALDRVERHGDLFRSTVAP